MIYIGTTEFYIGAPSMPRHDFEMYSTHLFDEWERYVEKTLMLSDYSLLLEVEEGSVKATARIATALGVLYFGIGNYGSFISGLQTIYEQVTSVSKFFAKRAALPFESKGLNQKVQKRGDSLSRLKRLFVKVQCGEMAVDQAMREAEELFGEEAASVPEFMHELHQSLKEAPLFPRQMSLPLDILKEQTLLTSSEKKRQPRPSQPRPNLPPPQQFRVEVWRESKKGQRKVSVTKL